jgi:hypothetical protein
MMACLFTLHRYRGLRLKPHGEHAYIIKSGEGLGRGSCFAWFPAWCVEGLMERGLVNAEGGLTVRGRAKLEARK